MAVLTPGTTGPEAPGDATVRWFPEVAAVLAAQSSALPQADQLCGPFAGRAALQAVLGDQLGDHPNPSIIEVAMAAGTAIWPHDVQQWRPAGAALDRTGWDQLPVASELDRSGTNAAGLAAGIETVTGGRVAVVPATGPGWSRGSLGALLVGVLDAPYPLGVVANVRTGPMATPQDTREQITWDVGHFVVLCGLDEEGDRIVAADSYRKLGAPRWPAGCRPVSTEALVRGLSAPPGRGLLLLVRGADAAATTRLVRDAGLVPTHWET